MSWQDKRHRVVSLFSGVLGLELWRGSVWYPAWVYTLQTEVELAMDVVVVQVLHTHCMCEGLNPIILPWMYNITSCCVFLRRLRRAPSAETSSGLAIKRTTSQSHCNSLRMLKSSIPTISTTQMRLMAMLEDSLVRPTIVSCKRHPHVFLQSCFLCHILFSVSCSWQGCSKAGLKRGMSDCRTSLLREFFRLWDQTPSATLESNGVTTNLSFLILQMSLHFLPLVMGEEVLYPSECVPHPQQGPWRCLGLSHPGACCCVLVFLQFLACLVWLFEMEGSEQALSRHEVGDSLWPWCGSSCWALSLGVFWIVLSLDWFGFQMFSEHSHPPGFQGAHFFFAVPEAVQFLSGLIRKTKNTWELYIAIGHNSCLQCALRTWHSPAWASSSSGRKPHGTQKPGLVWNLGFQRAELKAPRSALSALGT